MATLFNTKISATYPGLIKSIDNAALNASLRQLSDGSGNASGIYMNTAGDFKVTAILEFGSLKDTGENIIITKFVDAADGITNNNNDTSIPTSKAVKDFVETHVTAQDLDFGGDGGTTGAIDLDSQVFQINGTANEIETSASNQVLTIGLPNSVTISGTYTGATFAGQLNGTISSTTTATTQTAGNNSTKVATTAYVDTLDAASDLDFSGTSGTGAVNLNTQVFAVTGTANQIESTASGQGLSLKFPTAGVVLPNNSTATTQSAGNNSTKIATTAYVDTLDAASDLDIAGDSGSGDVNLNTQTFTLSGTTNQVTTAVSGQTATFSLPATVHRNLQGNVTGNADTATKWATARNLSLTGQATATLSSVDGTSNVSGAVTLDNNSVTAKVLTGLPTPSASSVLATDSIVAGIGKLQSQINGLAGGLRFMGTWNVATNSPLLASGGGETASGTTTATTANKLVDSNANFSGVSVGNKVVNQVDGQSALVSNVDSSTVLSLDADIMLSGEAYTVDASPFLTQGHYYVVSVGGARTLNGVTNWSVGDWAIVGANNEWTILDHTDVEGTGTGTATTGNIARWSGPGTIVDSNIDQNGTAVTVTGSLSTTTTLSSTGNFAVNTNKFTANATSGNVAFPGDLAINTDKFTVNATSGNTVVAGTLNSGAIISTENASINGTVIGTDQTFAGEYRTFAFGTNANGYNRIFATKNQTDGIYLASATGHGLKVRVNGNSTNVMTIDNSGNSTFSGTINSVGNITTDGIFKVDSAPDDNVLEVTQSGRKMALKTSFAGDSVGSFWAFRVSTGAVAGTMTDALIVKPQQATFANRVSAGESFNSVKDGADTVADGPFFALKNAAGTRQYINQLDASNNIDYWYYNGSAWTQTISLLTDGGATFAGNVAINNYLTINGSVAAGTSTFQDWKNDGTLFAYNGSAAAIISGGSSTDYVAGNTTGATNVILATNNTERMRILANGNITFNATSNLNASKFQISTASGLGANVDVFIANTSGVPYANSATTTQLSMGFLSGTANYVATGQRLGALQFFGQASDAGYGAGAIKSVVTTGGNVGRSSHAADLTFETKAAGSLGNEERMRITSGGNVLIGPNAERGKLTINSSATSGNSNALGIYAASDGGTHPFATFLLYGTSTVVGSITSNGTATSYNTSSDYRLKEDLQDFAGLDMVSKIPVYDFKWKTDESRSYGVMAHELEEVLPQAVVGKKDAEEMQSVDYSKIVPLLVKSIQELKAEVDLLKQECKCK